jgi:hypothetical protein
VFVSSNNFFVFDLGKKKVLGMQTGQKITLQEVPVAPCFSSK